MQNEEMQIRLDNLEGRLKIFEDDLSHPGGILSGKDIRELVIKGNDVGPYLELFKNRKWEELEDKKWERKILIDKYSEFNITPFSYDLSIGSQFFSVQKAKLAERQPNEPYELEPNEMVIVITEERIAIPMYYSATVWPRFNMVKQGVFQSMVKIDPTWYGKLAVAITNCSPAVVKLHPEKAFATLLIYTLFHASDYDLWEPKSENMEKVKSYLLLPEKYHTQVEALAKYIKDENLSQWVALENTSDGIKVKVYGLKRESLEKLQNFLKGDTVWKEFCEKLALKFAEFKNEETGRRFVWMKTLGQNDLSNITLSKDGRVRAEDERGKTCSDDDLLQIAETYGKPFDVIAQIPLTMHSSVDERLQHIREELISRIEGQKKEVEARVEAAVGPRMIGLMFSVLGTLSLIVAVLAMTIRLLVNKQYPPFDAWFYLMAFSPFLIVILLLFLGLTFLRWKNQSRKKTLGANEHNA